MQQTTGNDDTVREIAALITAQDEDFDEYKDAAPEAGQSHDQEGRPVEAGADDGGERLSDVFNDLFNSDAPDGVETDSEEAAPAADEEPGPVTVKELAQKLDLDPADLYNELEIPLGDDESITLGEYKDRVKELRNLDGERGQVTELRNEYEKSLLQTRTELSAILQVIPPEMRDQVLEVAKERSSTYTQEQSQAVLESIPAWKDADKLAEDRAGLVNMGAEYGFSEQEITYTQDARTLRMLHDYLRLRERVNNMEAATKRETGKPGRPGKNPRQSGARKLAQAIRGAKHSTDNRVKESVISELIRKQ